MARTEPVASTGGTAARDAEQWIRWYRALVTSRALEEFCIRLSGHWYAAVGEEATVVGTFGQLGPDDVALPHYRGALIVPWLRGAPLKEVLLTVIQRRTSPTRGRLYGSFAGNIRRGVFPFVTMVLGVNIAAANGIALALRRQGSSGVAVTSFGDGTAGTGEFHESLNMGATWKLPVVYVCQDNAYSISTPATGALAGGSLTGWAERYGLPASRVDGNDVAAVADAVGAAIARARRGDGPAFVHAVTYRRTGHFAADPAVYRPADEVARWAERDPIAVLEASLEANGVLGPDEMRRIREDASSDVEAAGREAESDAPLTEEDLGIGEVTAHGD